MEGFWLIVFLIFLVVIIYFSSANKSKTLYQEKTKGTIIKKVKIEIASLDKIFKLSEEQVIVVYQAESLKEVLKVKSFKISDYFSDKGIKQKSDAFYMYTVYIVDESVHQIPLQSLEYTEVFDPKYKTKLKFKYTSNIDFIICDIGKFIQEISGHSNIYNYQDFREYFNNTYQYYITATIVNYLSQKKLSITEANYHTPEVEKSIIDEINRFLSFRGLKITNIDLLKIDIQNDSHYQNLTSLLVKKQKYIELNYTYKQEKIADFIRNDNKRIGMEYNAFNSQSKKIIQYFKEDSDERLLKKQYKGSTDVLTEESQKLE